MEQITLYAAIAAIGGAALMLVLGGLGYLHLRQVGPTTELLPRLSSPDPAASNAS